MLRIEVQEEGYVPRDAGGLGNVVPVAIGCLVNPTHVAAVKFWPAKTLGYNNAFAEVFLAGWEKPLVVTDPPSIDRLLDLEGR